MAVEDDILKTLRSIETALKRSSSSTTGSTAGGRSGITQQRTEQQNNSTNKKSGQSTQKLYQATTKSMRGLGDTVDHVGGRMKKLAREVYATQGSFVALNKAMKVKPTSGNNFNSGGAATGGGGGKTPTATGVGAASLGPRSPAGKALGGFTNSLSFGKIAVIDFAANLLSAFNPVMKDLFQLQGRGISAADSLGGLYIDAIKAGMSLEAYTETLETANSAVARAGSFREFNDRISDTSAQLSKLGVFGADATKLSASLANSATVLGVPQSHLADATSRQVGVFEELRKTSLITADAFKTLTEDLMSSAEVQGELLGLAGNERSARLAELTQTRAIGVSMGLSAAASKELGDALIAQRKLTAVKRFEAAGTVRQAGAMLGIAAGDTQELAQLSRKKNRTAEEQTRFTQLAGAMQQKIEEAQNSGNVQREFMADQLSEKLASSGIGAQLEAAGKARLTSESGPIKNVDMGKKATETVEFLGKIYKWMTGLGANPIYTAVSAALTGAGFAGALALAMKGGLGRLTGPIMKMAGMDKFAGIGEGFVGPKKPGILGRAAGGVAKAGGGVLGAVTTGAKALPAIAGGVVKKALPFLGAIVDGLTEAFTGNVAAAFSPNANAFERIGNVVVASINGLVGGVFDLVDSIGEFFGLPENFFRNKFDIFTSWIRGQFFKMLAGMAKMVTLGADNPVSKYFQESADGAFKVVDQLVADSTATVTSIGAKNQKMLSEQKKTADAALGSTSKVINSTKGLTAMAVNTANGIVASPGATVRASVTPPEVNTPATDVRAEYAADVAKEAAAKSAVGTPETATSQMAQVIDLLARILQSEETQALLAQQLLRTPRQFGDNDVKVNRLMQSAG